MKRREFFRTLFVSIVALHVAPTDFLTPWDDHGAHVLGHAELYKDLLAWENNMMRSLMRHISKHVDHLMLNRGPS